MYNSRAMSFVQRTGSQTIMGNGNQVTIRDCREFSLAITGNGNQIIIKDSSIRLSITGNGNMINSQTSSGDLNLIGNGNNCQLGSCNIRIRGNMGNGNMISGGQRQQQRPQRNVNMNNSRRQQPQQIVNSFQHNFYGGLPGMNFMNILNNTRIPSSWNIIQQNNRGNIRRQISQPQQRNQVHINLISSQQSGDDESEQQYEEQYQEMNHGLVEKDLQKLPKSISKGSSDVCVVCMETFQKNQYETFLFCFHKFHTNCIHQWLRKKPECPMCQMKIRQHL